MENPIIEQTMQTGYAADQEETKVDMFGDYIEKGDLFFTFPNGDIVLAENLGHYAVQELNADEEEHGE